MKKFLITLTGVLTIGATLPAIAGPDWQLIEAARKAKAAATDTPKKLVLPLDHGPRAQTTPWSNQQRRLRAEQEARAKAEAKGTSMPASVK